jgi:hypothetical protein
MLAARNEQKMRLHQEVGAMETHEGVVLKGGAGEGPAPPFDRAIPKGR